MWVQRADERYRGGDEAGVDTRHAFSFSGFYDPDNVRFGLLVACNEERLAPGAGFDSHPHRDLEIVTWVVTGELTHEDSTGQRTVVRAGDVQRLSAGSGVRHAERNTGTEPLRFVQMWLTPTRFGGQPEYEVVRGIPDGTPYPLPHAEASLRVHRPAPGHPVALPDAPWLYVHVVHGTVGLAGETLAAGDSARVTDSARLTAEAIGDGAGFLVWEMRGEPVYG
ncbi:pirin [Streptomyces albus subsp. albus]|nr:pirin [Streptomyces albus subsp. albus]